MPKLALLVTTFLFFVFLLQQSSSGVFEDFEYVGTDNDLKLESDIVSTDIQGMKMMLKDIWCLGRAHFMMRILK